MSEETEEVEQAQDGFSHMATRRILSHVKKNIRNGVSYVDDNIDMIEQVRRSVSSIDPDVALNTLPPKGRRFFFARIHELANRRFGLPKEAILSQT